MAVTIYTVGEVEVLEGVLNGVAMLTSGGHTGDIARIGGILGVTFVMLSGVMNGGRIEWGSLLAGFLLFLCMFVPSITVIIESAKTGEVRVVGNVPYGAAIPGWIVTTVGREITDKFETAFAYPGTGVTDQGFGQTLSMYKDLERVVATGRIFTALDQANGGGRVDTFASIKNYLRECTIKRLEKQGDSPSKVRTMNTSEWHWVDASEGTELFLDPAGPAYHDCDSGWTALRAATFAQLSSVAMRQVLDEALGINTGEPSGRSAISELTKNNQALGHLATDTQEFMYAIITEPASIAAQAEHEGNMDNAPGATALEMKFHQGRIQKESGLIGTGFAWDNLMFSLMSFAEVVFLIFTPLLALFVMLGAGGIKLAGKFMLLGVWIQMWQPMMAAVDLYIDYSAKDAMEVLAMDFSATPNVSIHEVSEIARNAQEALATGNSFIPMIPIMSLFLLTGSMMAATRMFDPTNRAAADIGQGSSIDDKHPAPFTNMNNGEMSMGAGLGLSSHQTIGGMSGVQFANANPTEITFGRTNSSAVSETQSKIDSTSNSLAANSQQAWSSMDTLGQRTAVAASVGRNLGSMESSEAQHYQDTAAQIGKSYNLSETDQEILAGQIAMKASGNAGVKIGEGISANSGISGGVTGTAQSSDQASLQDTLARMDNEGFRETTSAGFRSELGARFAESVESNAGTNVQSGLTDTISSQSQELAQYTEQQQAMDTQQASTGASFKRDVGSFTADEKQAINEAFSNVDPALRQPMQEKFQQYFDNFTNDESIWGMSEPQALAAAQAMALNDFNQDVSFLDPGGSATLPSGPENSTTGVQTHQSQGGGAVFDTARQDIGGMDTSDAHAVFADGARRIGGDADIASDGVLNRGEYSTAHHQAEGAIAQMNAYDGKFEHIDDLKRTGDDAKGFVAALSSELGTEMKANAAAIEGAGAAFMDGGFGGLYSYMAGDGEGTLTGDMGAARIESRSDFENQMRADIVQGMPEGLTEAQQDLYVNTALAQNLDYASTLSGGSYTDVGQYFNERAELASSNAAEAHTRVNQEINNLAGGDSQNIPGGAHAPTIISNNIIGSALQGSGGGEVALYNDAVNLRSGDGGRGEPQTTTDRTLQPKF